MTTTTPTATTAVTDPTRNLAVVRRFVDEVINRGHLDVIDDIVHADYAYHGPGGVRFTGREGAAAVVSEFRQGFSDLHAVITSEVAQDDRVAMTLLLTGTHDGELTGIHATEERIELPIAIVTRVAERQIVEDREYYDTATLMAQLGLTEPAA
jgi:predicted ester cyclase